MPTPRVCFVVFFFFSFCISPTAMLALPNLADVPGLYALGLALYVCIG